MTDAIDIRGEVDLVLEGQAYVLRPSYQAIVAMEKKTGKPLVELAALAEQCVLAQDVQAIVTTELIRAWGRSLQVDEYATAAERVLATSARGANPDTIGEMLYAVGPLAVQPRLAMVLGLAATGGCLPSG
ncbi:MAG TPA: GTA-gp10 family protein, partial [Sphingobium sp.]